jgi:pimeloyl-ACP methyl ester carboxylesterase
MGPVEELVAAGSIALRLPGMLRRRDATVTRTVCATPAGPHGPVLLVHGYAGSGDSWEPLRQALGAAGFGDVLTLSYNSFAGGVPDLAAGVATHARAAAAGAGRPVHLVGHSLGGLLLRYAVHRHGLGELAATAVTIATPHRGTPYALLGRVGRLTPGRCVRHMAPGSALFPLLCGPAPMPTGTRWISFYSDADRVAPPWSARLSDPRLHAANVVVPGCRHLTICRDPRIVTGVVDHLLRSENLPVNPLEHQ